MKKLIPKHWEVVKSMEQHTEKRQLEAIYKVNQANIVDFLLNYVFTKEDVFTREDINAAIDVLDVNAFEIRGLHFR